jgi:hypothetical protein|tara:strand:- start:118 stop:735 length:618 start_codon:yes stop_codon:yes gene_type:complete
MIHNLTNDEILSILKYRDGCERIDKLHGIVNHKIVNKSDFDWLLDKFNITGRIFGGNYFSTPNPFFIHTDTGKAEDLKGAKSLYNIVIPLVEDETFNTVLFDQTYLGEAAHFYVGNVFKYFPKPVYNHVKNNYADVNNMTSVPFDLIQYKTYLTHMPYETVQGLSIKKVIPWNIGEAMVFPSCHLHSASNFVGRKEGLTLLVCDV